MTKRSCVFAAGTALLLISCAASDQQSSDAIAFTSDRITVVARGAGDDIILVPGLASHRDVWAAVADSLEDEYRLHLVQVKGFAGLEPEANADGPVSAPVAEEIARYIRETNLDRPAVIGHSMGGSIGMMLAARHPDLVGRLMVVDMPPYLGTVFAPDASPEEMRETADAYYAQIMADTAGSPTGVLEQMFASMTLVDSLKPMLLEGVRGTNRRTAANSFRELMMTDLRPELASITMPVAVLYAVTPETPPAIDSGYRESFSALPHARLIRFDDAAHFIFFDQPGRFVAEVRTLMNTPVQ